MVKKNKILVGCLALLLALSVGYALFSETITINGTATAKGSFDITTTCMPGYSDELLVAMGLEAGNNDLGQGGFENSICDVKDNTVAMTTDLLYPESMRIFTVKMTNTGSIPAIIWGTTQNGMSDSLRYEDSVSWFKKSKSDDSVITSGIGPDFQINGMIEGNTDRILNVSYFPVDKSGVYGTDANVIYDNINKKAAIKLNPGDSLFAAVEFYYGDRISNNFTDNGKSEYFEFKFNHTFNWEQYTDNSNYESTTFDEWCFAGC